MKKLWFLLIVLAVAAAFLGACSRIRIFWSSGASSKPLATPALEISEAQEAIDEFVGAWANGDFAAMYRMLTAEVQKTISESEFITRYQNIQKTATITAIRTAPAAITVESEHRVVVELEVTLDTILVGQVKTRNRLTWERDDEHWRIAWTPAAIFEDLADDLQVHLAVKTPQRGNIYARDGSGLALQGKLITVGVVPAWIKDEAKLLDVLSSILNMPREEIRRKYTSALRPDWFMPIADITPEQSAAYQNVFTSLSGVSRQEKAARVYPNGSLASHIVGYSGEIDAEELAQWRSLGYQPGDIVGKAGIERWAESHLAGRRGAILSITTAAGQPVAVLKEQVSQPSKSVYLTLDPRLQEAAHRALGDRAGAIVALDPINGQILAMVSRPAVDANDLATGLSPERWQALLEHPAHPLLNRATLGLYPPGSVFKIVSMAAALEKAGFSAASTFFCSGSWAGLSAALVRTCWFKAGHGHINLADGLTQSCDIVFYEIGKALDSISSDLLPEYARQFGFGQTTGVQGLDETAGLVPDPRWKDTHRDAVSNPFWTAEDTVNLSIGQGYLLATPLQIANMLAAVANGGTLYRPRIVQQIMSLQGGDTIVFEPEEIGRLPISTDHLALIRESLRRAVMSPQGTAYLAFEGVQVPMAGKTGTAETAQKEPHAWFAGYAPADHPTIAVAVVVEHAGEGGQVAAPIFRQVVESYLGIAPPPTKPSP